MTRVAEIKLMAAGLQLGETLRAVCPSCGGGSSGEESFAVTRDETNTLIWVCHRASCGCKGSTSSAGNIIPRHTLKPRPSFKGTTQPLSDEHRGTILELWGISEPPYWYWTPEYGGRVAMSIRSPKYSHRGWVLRDIRGVSKVKALTYIDEGEEGISWYKTHPNVGTVIVEDIPSAVRASRYVNSVALLGTGVGLDRANEIAEYAPRPIIMALDQDATALSFKWARRYAALWGDVQVLMLDKDIKDMTEEESWTLLNKFT